MESIKICPECRKRITPVGCVDWREVGKDFIDNIIEPFLDDIPGGGKLENYSLEKEVCIECAQQGSV